MSGLTVPFPHLQGGDVSNQAVMHEITQAFEAAYRQRFAFLMQGKALVAEAVSVEAVVAGDAPQEPAHPLHPAREVPRQGTVRMFTGGTDGLARAFADASRKHMSQPIVVLNRPGAGGAIGWSEVINSKPDGYKLAVVTVELLTLPHLGLAKFKYDDFQPIAQLNADPAAITVKADAPWNSVEEFLAAAKKDPGAVRVGNSGNGSIWHLAAAALEDKTNTKFNHIPFNGAAPAVLALPGGHIEAVAVSPAEVTTHVQGGKPKTLSLIHT